MSSGPDGAVRPANSMGPVPPDGSWSGPIDVDDPGGVPLTYTVTGPPQLGEVEVFPDGTYTYVPTQAARLRAALASPGTETGDGFSIEATGSPDEIGCSVWGPVAPATVTLTHQIPFATSSTPVTFVASSDGSRLYVVDFFGQGILVVGTEDYTIQAVALPGGPLHVALGPLDRSLYVTLAADPPQILVLDTNTLTVKSSTPVRSSTSLGGGALEGLAVSNDGRYVYVGNASEPTVIVLDTSDDSMHAISLPTAPNQPQALALSRDGRKLWVACTTASTGDPIGAWVIDTTTYSVTPLHVQSYADALCAQVAVSPDDARVYLPQQGGLDTGTGHITVIDTATYLTHDIALPGSPVAVGFSSDSSVLYVNSPLGYSGGAIVVVDAKTEQVITTFDAQGNAPQFPLMSPDGTHLYLSQATPPQIEVYTYAGTGKWTA